MMGTSESWRGSVKGVAVGDLAWLARGEPGALGERVIPLAEEGSPLVPAVQVMSLFGRVGGHRRFPGGEGGG